MMQIRAEARVEPQDDDAAPEAPKAEEGGGNNTPQQTEATVEPHEGGPVQPEAPEVEGGGTGMSVKPEEEAGDVAGEAGIELSSSAGASDLALAT